MIILAVAGVLLAVLVLHLILADVIMCVVHNLPGILVVFLLFGLLGQCVG